MGFLEEYGLFPTPRQHPDHVQSISGTAIGSEAASAGESALAPTATRNRRMSAGHGQPKSTTPNLSHYGAAQATGWAWSQVLDLIAPVTVRTVPPLASLLLLNVQELQFNLLPFLRNVPEASTKVVPEILSFVLIARMGRNRIHASAVTEAGLIVVVYSSANAIRALGGNCALQAVVMA